MKQPRNDITALFSDVWEDADFRFEIKAQEIATDLARALHEAGMTRTQLAEKLDWKPSRISKVLGGGANLTLKTLHELCEAIGLEFDVILRGSRQARAAQPWEVPHIKNDIRRLLDDAQHAHARTQAMFETARRLNQNSWQRASYMNRLVETGHVFNDLPMMREAC
ncbi:helix-turn-helix domain-containing protein [Luteimonas sp. MHLX1A]|uniref:helix-turn-helix domain-containing protein n=1 Tax=Alterluteimonas muca TaxID=2878684 RepID=UPI001E58F214|nr:helix-turn-helix transcriptional regulator [Luteimonas sp. MHLX1A]MCD9047144.1 helix-turn-helix domain-containing protein [Luteimonas sp. MHLX1A]